MSDEFLFQCAFCGIEFEPDPDCVLECGVSRRFYSTEEAAKLIEDGEAWSLEDLGNMSDEELEKEGMSPEDRDRVMGGEPDVITGGVTICRKCQSEGEKI